MKKYLTLCGLLLCVCSFAASPVTFKWGDTDIHYKRDKAPTTFVKNAFAFPAWKGEKVNAEAVIWSPVDIKEASVSVSKLTCGKHVIPAEAVSVNFIKYVIGDVLADCYWQCAPRDSLSWPKIYSPDLIDNVSSGDIAAQKTQPVWISVKVPADAAPGKYRGKVTLKGSGMKAMNLALELEVVDRQMPSPSEWGFHLDLWQNPYSVARWHNVPLWSDEHFEHLRPVMKLLADSGQKVITATILDRPWNGQTEDAFGTMVTKIKRADGSWLYDYTIFDKWVSFMMDLGIDKQINCYTMASWKMSFDYFDQATYSVKTIDCKPDTEEFKEYWGSFLKDFQEHLRAKGWLEKTNIAMDEIKLETMQGAIEVIKNAAPEIGISLAGYYHEEIQADINDLSITSTVEFPADVRAQRQAKGMASTYYTCCSEGYPNTFMGSVPAEASWMGWYALAHNFDGYLRWAFNSWTKNPVVDARFRNFASGDCYMAYPDGRSSVRLEKLVEGIRDYEKARIMMAEWETNGETAKLENMQNKLDDFIFENIPARGAAIVSAARGALVE